jgi:hypothetical protein
VNLSLAFGPLHYSVSLHKGVAALPWCENYGVHPITTHARCIEVNLVDRVEVPAVGFVDDGFCVERRGSVDVVFVERLRPWRWEAAMCALLAQDAPAARCLVIHGCAVKVVGGVALLVAPRRTGKTTFAQNAGVRAFAHNAVVVEVREQTKVWALPFAHDGHLELVSGGCAVLQCLATLVRGEFSAFEWLPRANATVQLIQACARAPGHDALAHERFVVALDLLSSTKTGRLTTTRGPNDLWPLDQALAAE